MEEKRVIKIMVAIDVIGALESDTLEGHIYLFGNNRSHGSVGHGTAKLKTKLSKEFVYDFKLIGHLAH